MAEVHPGERLAIINGAHVAIEDHTGKLAVVFAVNDGLGGQAAAWVLLDERERFESVWEAMLGNVANLNGKACIVDVSEPHLMIFRRMAKL
jgi:hypothetical protein